MTLRLLEDWSRGMNLRPRRALLVTGIPPACGAAAVEEALRAGLAPLGEPRLLGRMFWRGDGRTAALVALAEDAPPAAVPEEIPGPGGAWRVLRAPPGAESEFPGRPHGFPRGGGLTPARLTGALGLGGDPPAAPRAPRHERLRVFSGRRAPGPGEDDFEAWLFHAKQVMKTWQAPDGERRRRLLESLRGPALDVVRALEADDPAVSVAECLRALEQVFGVIDNSRELQVKFLTTYQRDDEKLSAYVLRLEPLLQKLVERGAVEMDIVNQARLDQVVAGAVQRSLRRKLALPEDGQAPGLLQLLALIQEEEAAAAAEEAFFRAGLQSSAT